jgi:hypothetical protein
VRTISLASFQKQVSARKAALGMKDAPDEIEAMRNKGSTRTPAKRELLRRTERRARDAGVVPIVSYF